MTNLRRIVEEGGKGVEHATPDQSPDEFSMPEALLTRDDLGPGFLGTSDQTRSSQTH